MNFTVTLKGTKYSHKSEQRVRNKERREIAGAKGKIISLWVKVQCEKFGCSQGEGKMRERAEQQKCHTAGVSGGYVHFAGLGMAVFYVRGTPVCKSSLSILFSSLFSSRIR